ncbi:ATPdependent RNA helicase [Dinochytrium kinnereticum]|nr:ATPdependent RNA helicase [Dinochytrium kinnereticum]
MKAQTGSFQRLITVPISKSSAKQRAGRAGRIAPGKVFRLYTEEAYRNLALYAIPEIQRSELTQVVLQLKALGVENVLRFEYLSPPSTESLMQALEVLYCLKALDDYGRLTMPFGAQMAELPVAPFVAAMILNSHIFKCTEEILSIAACISVQSVYLSGKGDNREDAQDIKRMFWVEEGDHISLLNVYGAFIEHKMNHRWCEKHLLDFRALSRAKTIRSNLENYLKRLGYTSTSAKNDIVAVRKCILSGFFPYALFVTDYLKAVRIHPTSVLFNRSPKYVLFGEMLETDKKWIRDVTVIDDASWLTEIASHYYSVGDRRS